MQLRDLNGTQLAVIRPASGGFPRHSHDEYVISVNLCGRERVRLDRSSFEVDLDEVTVYNPGQVQSCTTAPARPRGRRRAGAAARRPDHRAASGRSRRRGRDVP